MTSTNLLAQQNSKNESFKLTILHLNDHHAHLDGEDFELNFDGIKTKVELGGFPRVATKIKELKAKAINPLVLHAGDAMSGTLYYTIFKGQADVELMNMIGFDAYTLGNHEFDEGDKVLADFIDKAKFPIVTSNVEVKKGSVLENRWKPYIIKDIKGEKVAIIGLESANKTKSSSRASEDVVFFDEFFRAQKYVSELQEKGINKIILLSHFGYENDLELAKKIDGIDIIVGGDSHALLGDFKEFGLSSVGEYPTKTLSKNSKNVCVVQAWEYAKVVGELNVEFNSKGDVINCGGKPNLLIGETFTQNDKELNKEQKSAILKKIENSNISITKENPEILAKLNHYKKEIEEKSKEVVGVIKEDLRHIRIPMTNYGDMDGSLLPLGSEIAPVIAEAFYNLSLRADACIQNAGGVRSGLLAGEINVGGVYTLLPFSNTLFEFDIKGSEIKQLLEDAIINYNDNRGSDGSFPYAYALRYDIDMNREKNSRVYNLEIKDRKTKKWQPLEADKSYVIVTNSYIANGKDGYTTLKELSNRGKGIDTYLDYAMSFVNYAKEKKEISRLPKDEHCIKSYTLLKK
ncbi:MAG: NAD nucleotidase [Campylobacterales bacterium]|nr:NAD nucleotidase [Campylobacterales bacterium]